MSKAIFLHNNGSQGGIALAKAMGIKRLRHDNSQWKGGAGNVLINWGSQVIPERLMLNGTRIINDPARVRDMSNKLRAFERFTSDGGVSIPDFTRSLEQARKWLAKGSTVFARTNLNGHSGAGIEIMEPDHPDTHNVVANLYTRYIPKDSEYRIHICSGEVIIVQRKGLSQEFQNQPDVNWKIRNLANGFIFARQNVNPPEDVLEQARRAMRASGLVFGAVDVIYNQKRGQAYVLEVNTAPGLVGTSVDDYARAFEAL